MADLQFFATEEDHASLVSLLVARFNARFVLDGATTPEMPTFESVAEVMHIIKSEMHDPRFFVLSPLWQLEPLTVSETKHNDGRVRFYIRQQEGGPAFDYLARRLRIVESGEQLIPSWFSDYPFYRSRLEMHSELVRPSAMAAAYKEVQHLTQRSGARTDISETRKPGPWAMPGALSAYSRGGWLRAGEWHHTPRTPKLTPIKLPTNALRT